MAARQGPVDLPFANDEEKMKDFNDKVALHYEAAAELEKWKENERIARAALIDMLYPEGITKEGTDNWAMPANWVLKIAKRFNVKVDESQIATVRKELEELPVDEDGVVNNFDGAIKFEPKFSATGFKMLTEAGRKVVAKCLDFTPGTPGVELVLPKKIAPKASAKSSFNPFGD